jgi:hypothetical protein
MAECHQQGRPVDPLPAGHVLRLNQGQHLDQASVTPVVSHIVGEKPGNATSVSEEMGMGSVRLSGLQRNNQRSFVSHGSGLPLLTTVQRCNRCLGLGQVWRNPLHQRCNGETVGGVAPGGPGSAPRTP